MPEVVIPLHEIYARHIEVPDVPDCFLVSVWNEDIADDSYDQALAIGEGAFPPMPWLASKFDPLTMAREGNSEDWNVNWGAKENGNSVRLGLNSPSIGTPIYMRFRWGEGIPTVDGISILPHLEAVMEAGYNNRVTGKPVFHRLDLCNHCSTGMRDGTLADCRGRRMIALADAVVAEDTEAISLHLRAIDQWHRTTRVERLRNL